MKEYNWREEREKFRPEFQQKTQKTEGFRQPFPGEPEDKDPRRIIAAVAVIAVIVIVIVAIMLKVNRTPEKQSEQESVTQAMDSSAMLAEIAEKNGNAVGVVTINYELQNGFKNRIPIGTAWAFSENKFATNAHVVQDIRSIRSRFVTPILLDYAAKEGCKDLQELFNKVGEEKFKQLCAEAEAFIRESIKGITVTIVIHRGRGKSYLVSHYQTHKDYGMKGTSFNPDVAVLTIRGKHDSCFKIANENALYALRAGDAIAFLGFPMENLEQDNMNISNPIATMQTGIISAVSDFDMKDAGADGNYLIRHNLPATGGASGSPIFTKNGEVIALLHEGNIIGQITKYGKVDRAPSAAQVNFGVRVDLIEGMGELKPISELVK